MKRHFIVLLVFAHSNLCFSQNQILIDSLNIVIERSENTEDRFKAYEELFNHYIYYDYGKALEVGLEGYTLAVEQEDIRRQTLFLHRLGNTYLYMGNYDKSLEEYFKGLNLLENQENHYLEFAINTNIGGIYDRIQSYDKALEYLFRALEIFNSYHQTFNEGVNKATLHCQLFNNIGNIYEVKDDNEKALQYYLKALDYPDGEIHHEPLAGVYNNLGKLYKKLKDFDKAKKNLEKGLEIRLANQNHTGIIKSYNNLCNYYLEINKPDSALITLKKTTDMVQQSGSLELKAMYYYSLFSTYAKMGLYQNALEEHINFQVVKDSLVNKQNLMQISNLEAEQKINNLEKEYLIKQQKVKFRNNIIFIGLIGLIILAILLIALIIVQKKRIKIKKDALEADLDYRNKEMATNVMYLVRKNELINDVAKRLMQLKENLKEENKSPIHSIIYELQTEVDKEVWNEFEMRFQQVHKNFYDNLRDSHPDLTPNEERLCAFLRLNMSSKEIAAINHQNAKSIEVARARLRKKLNLTGTDTNLISYLAEF